MPRTYKLKIKEEKLRENYSGNNIMILIKSLSEYLTYNFSSSYVRPSHRLYFTNVGLLIIVKDSNYKSIGTITTYFDEELKTFRYLIRIIYEDERKCSNYGQVKSFIELYKQKHNIMELDEAINHAEEVYKKLKDSCPDCANEHKQLAEWLKDYKEIKSKQRNLNNDINKD
mgnify:CR=1 FL=1